MLWFLQAMLVSCHTGLNNNCQLKATYRAVVDQTAKMNASLAAVMLRGSSATGVWRITTLGTGTWHAKWAHIVLLIVLFIPRWNIVERKANPIPGSGETYTSKTISLMLRASHCKLIAARSNTFHRSWFIILDSHSLVSWLALLLRICEFPSSISVPGVRQVCPEWGDRIEFWECLLRFSSEWFVFLSPV